MSVIEELSTKVLRGELLCFEEAKELLAVEGDDIYELLVAANRIRKKFTGNKVELCSIAAGKVGGCSEDCAFCAQSVHHKAVIKENSSLNRAEIVAKAVEMENKGAHRFSLVNSGYGPSAEEFAEILNIFAEIRSKTKIKLCASLGVINQQMARRLAGVGVTMYHHNVETSRSFFPKICTTHSYEDRLRTIEAVKKAGMKVCCGGVISMGETAEQRLEMAFEIRSLDVHSVPVNILNPIRGTPLANQVVLSPLEILKTIAIFRFVMPAKLIRFAGGRIPGLRDLQAMGFMAGINASIIGDYLTTYGRSITQDLRMIKDMGLEY
ncbi:biotin synthase [Desulfohalotomaculum tongense]|uniref:biotin synthase BioB n=1 Tax=Desulforadius tongensis TaxID=1216062 RepID=UPI00195F1951|nr:biotin synthase BioB [Desulforadius tongensis]MBM7854598.1 biotin synthase [Desulforadius tongensis]